MIVAQFTDAHVVRPGRRFHFTVDTAAMLEAAVACANRLTPRPDVVLVTGDVGDTGHPAEYARAARLLAGLAVPYAVIPGNHDEPEALASAFGAAAGERLAGGTRVHTLDRHAVRLVGIDSTQRNWPGGLLDDERLAWLDRTLAADTRPTIVFMHHPPLWSGVHYLDAFGFSGRRRFGAVIARHRHVLRILGGHIHRQIDVPWNGTIVSTSISTAPQYVPELFMRKPLGLTRERPGFRLYRWNGAALETETVVTAS